MTMPGASADARLQRNQRVVDDENPRLVADALHDAADHRLVGRAIDARNAQADGGRPDIPIGDGCFHHRVEHLFERQLSGSLQVGAFFVRGGHQAACVIRQQADGLRAADVDAKNMHSRYITLVNTAG